MQERSKKLAKYVLPTVLSQLCFFLFTIIDGIFVGNGIGMDALGAVNIAYPFIMLISALNMLITMGGSTVAAIRLGRGDKEGANQVFMHSVFAMVIASVVVSVLGMTLTAPIGRLLGAKDVYIDYVTDYMFWYSVFIVPSSISVLLQGFGRNDGAPTLVMIGSIVSSLINIFLDWLFVFPLKMGLKGAAMATGIAQCSGLLIVLVHFVFKRGDMHFAKFTLTGHLFAKIALRGFPETIAQLSMPIATICMNRVLLAHIGSIAVNSFSIVSYVASFSMAIFFGVSGGSQPLYGQCYGEKNEPDLKYYFRTGLIVNFIGSVTVYTLVAFIGGYIGKLFGADSATSDFTAKVMPQYGWGFILMSFNTLISAYLYSTKRSKEAIIANLCRSIVFAVSVTLLLPMIFGSSVIWYTFGIFEFLSLICFVGLMLFSERNGIVYK